MAEDGLREGSLNPDDFNEIRILKQDGFRGFTPIPVMVSLRGSASVATDYLGPFFIAQRRYVVEKILERHGNAGLGAATVDVKKAADGTSVPGGTSLLSSAISLTAAADTLQEGTLTTTLPDLVIEPDDSLGLESSGDISTCQNVTIAVYLRAV